MLFNAAEHAQFRFDNDALGMSRFNHTPCDGYIFIKRIAAGIDHDRAVKTGLNAVITGGFIAVVQVNRKNGFRIDFISGANQSFKKSLISIAASTLADLNDKRRLRVEVAAEQANNLFEIVDVIGANGVLTIGMFK